MSSEPSKKKRKSDKRTDLTGWSDKLNPERVEKMKKHKVAGDWRRFGTLKVNHVNGIVKWEKRW